MRGRIGRVAAAAGIAAALLLHPAGHPWAQTNYTNYTGWMVPESPALPPQETHPSLFFRQSDLPEILARRNQGGYAATLWNDITNAITAYRARVPSAQNTSERPRMAKYLAFASLALGDTAARSKAIQTLLIAYDNVPRTEIPSSFTDEYDEIYRATWLQNYCAAYDWLKPHLDVAADTVIRRKLTEEVRILRANMVEGARYATRPHNHRSKPAYGIGTGALTFSADPRAADWLQFSLAMQNTVTRYQYSADGAYREGGHYNLYAMVNGIPFLWHYRNVSGVDNFPAYAPAFEWPVRARTGRGWMPHFEDSYVKPFPTHMAARAYRSAATTLHSTAPLAEVLQWHFFNTTIFNRAYTGASNDATWELDEYIFYDQTIAQARPDAPPMQPLASGQVIFRSDWTSAPADRRYLAFQGIAQADNHNQPDFLGFMMEGYDCIQAVPPGYGRDGASDPLRASWYLQPKAQNIVSVNNLTMQDTAQNAAPATLHLMDTPFFDMAEKAGRYPVLNARQRRAVAFPRGRYFVVSDILTADQPADFRLYLHARGSMQRTGARVIWTTGNSTYGAPAALLAAIASDGTPAFGDSTGWSSLFKDQEPQQYVTAHRNAQALSFLQLLFPAPATGPLPAVTDLSTAGIAALRIADGSATDLALANRSGAAWSADGFSGDGLHAWASAEGGRTAAFALTEGTSLADASGPLVQSTNRTTLAYARHGTGARTGWVDSTGGTVTLATGARADSVEGVAIAGQPVAFTRLSNDRVSFSPSRTGKLEVRVAGSTGAGEGGGGAPEGLRLEQNFPNPFNPRTAVRFSVPGAQRVRMAVYDVLGREVAVLADGLLEAGEHVREFDASALASGVFVVRLSAGGWNATRKAVLLR